MNQPIISIIVAVWPKNELGKDNQLLWHIPSDMKRFKELTSWHPVIMWRKTFESIPEKFRPLPNRTNIIISRNPELEYDWVLIFKDIEKAIEKAKSIDENEIFIIGWAQIYNSTINIADKLYLTKVEWNFDADVFFPDYSMFNKVISKQDLEDNWFKISFIELVK